MYAIENLVETWDFEHAGGMFRAFVIADDVQELPDTNDCGFWPSKNPEDAGYVLPENFDTEQERAETRMAAFRAGDWFYVGVVVSRLPEYPLPDHISVGPDYRNALWGIESDAGDYLRQVAVELAGEA